MATTTKTTGRGTKAIEAIMTARYGVGLVAASPETVRWAADQIVDPVEALAALDAARKVRDRHGKYTPHPRFGDRLFAAWTAKTYSR